MLIFLTKNKVYKISQNKTKFDNFKSDNLASYTSTDY